MPPSHRRPFPLVGAALLLLIAINIVLFARSGRLQSEPLVDHTNHWQVDTVFHDPRVHPSDIVVGPAREVYIADRKRNCVWLWRESSGLSLFANEIQAPSSIALDSSGNIWVSTDSEPVITCISQDHAKQTVPLGAHVRSVFEIEFDSVTNALLLFSRLERKILRFEKSGATTSLIDDSSKLGGSGIGRAYSFTRAPDAGLYVLDFENCIQHVASDGTRNKRAPKKRPSEWGITGRLAYGDTVGLVVLDIANKRLLRMESERFVLLKELRAEHGLNNPNNVSCGPNGSVYLCDEMHGSVVRLSQQ